MKRQGWLLAIAGVCIIALCVGIWFLIASDPVLPKIASPVATTTDWYLKTYGDYYWLSSGEVMFFRKEGSRWTAYRRNIQNGSESAMTGFNERYKESHGDANYVVDVAPDGQHIFWWVHANMGDYLCICCSDGSDYKRLEDAFGSDFYWMADSAHIFRFVQSDVAKSRIIPIDHLNVLHSHAIVPIHKDSTITLTGLNLGNMGQGNFLVLTENRVLASNQNDAVHSIKLYDCGLGGIPPVAKKSVVKLPDKTECLNVLFSPTGDRIAWLLRTQRVPPFAVLLHKIWPRYNVMPQSVVSLRVSRTDGSGMHEIGYFPKETPKPDDSEWLSAYHLAWLPDNSHVSFLDHDKLYTLSAN